ncbi:MAG TPA: hypothetical protein VMH05_25545 [Bryobacteraceae bacterium]|nr:hypothetical protein [Bryobacteraceae bacterium]
MNLKAVYRALLRLFPEDYRSFFEAEMLDAFGRASEEQRARGLIAYGRFVCTELAGLVLSAPLEWIAKTTTSSSIRARSLPDLRLMRPAGVPREVWFASARTMSAAVPDEIAEAERRVEFCLRRMECAIATHDFQGARFYSNEDLKARENLRLLRAKRGPSQ